MFWKLVVCVISMGIFGCSLLAMRQARLQAAHELAQTQLRIRASDERLFKLRAQIGFQVRPEDVRSMVAEMTTLKPITPPVPDADAPVIPDGQNGKPATAGPKDGSVKPGNTDKSRTRPGSGKGGAKESESVREAVAPAGGLEDESLLAIQDGENQDQ